MGRAAAKPKVNLARNIQRFIAKVGDIVVCVLYAGAGERTESRNKRLEGGRFHDPRISTVTFLVEQLSIGFRMGGIRVD